jgi:hypothetical protein
MNKFRELGLIDYHKGSAEITILAEALTDSILRDEDVLKTGRGNGGKGRKT